MATIRQQIYTFLTLNPNSSTADVADKICRSEQYTVKTMHCMKLAGMLLSEKTAGSLMHTWRVSNRAVKFNTGESVRAKGKRKSNQMSTIRFEISELKAMIQKLEKSLA